MKKLRIIYMGTPEFAVPGLKTLIENGYNIVGVVTAPDKPKGRGLQLSETPLKMFAKEHGIKILQPEKLKDLAFLAELKSLKADLQIVVAFRMLPEAVWNMPPLGTFNLHASLLPQFRGAAPINWAIINGEKETGVTTFFLKHEIDTGDLIMQEKEPVFDEDSAGSLYERLMDKGASVILKTVQMIESGSVKPIPQPYVADLKPAPKIFRENCEITWNKPAEQIRNFIRGLSPHPAAFFYLNETYCKIFEAEVTDELSIGSGEFLTDGKNYLKIGTWDKNISVKSLQPEGKKKMFIKEFLMGHQVKSIGK